MKKLNSKKKGKIIAMILSILIFIAGLYFVITGEPGGVNGTSSTYFAPGLETRLSGGITCIGSALLFLIAFKSYKKLKK